MNRGFQWQSEIDQVLGTVCVNLCRLDTQRTQRPDLGNKSVFVIGGNYKAQASILLRDS